VNATCIDCVLTAVKLSLSAEPNSTLVRVADNRLNIAALTEAIRRGDQAAFEKFYDLYCDRLYHFLLALTRGQEEISRDVLQTVMIKAASKFPVSKTEGELWSWLAKVTRNALIDHMRQLLRRGRAANIRLDDVPELAIEPSADSWQMTWLDSAIESLEPDDQQLLRAFYLERRSYSELAGFLGKTPKAVESKLARIRQELRSLLQRRRHDE
jgi:RNA polymerase sigma-70 factor (ECF subfamily)